MKRRNFLASGGALGAISLLPYSCLKAPEPRYKLGYQLFSIRDEMAKDPIATLKALKKMGYEDFEHYGFDADNGTYYGVQTAEFKSILDDMELGVSSGHYPFATFFEGPEADMFRYLEQCIEGALTMDSKYIVWPLIEESHRNMEGYKKLAPLLNRMGQLVTDAGLGFAYHNHGYEFEDFDGITGFDIITKETDPALVKLQMDMYWIMYQAKTTPIAMVNAHPGRFVMWHIKDMHPVTRDYTELGNGSINYLNVLPDPQTAGLEYFYIEQGGNYTEDSTKSAAFSAAYFKNNLQVYF